ncbi:aromatic amino acid DMT transporter YddG [Bifidobacterium stellenboschense]|uniref:Putative permease n=1 Tax=Bifidobacterium stellenboschense TaxID=762211 RepID=A0A087DPE4_9BIFI|nr:aromatic amino acid DMT transporter YddG [Bifidobacterium stellenboschense]KFI97394.1 putative permease [Bifidobacterium stellenboschense]
MDADEKRLGYVPATRATAVGLLAIVVWSLMTALVRVVAESFGATLGSALIYTAGVALLLVFHRPAPLARYPKRYLMVGGALFVFYESSISLSIGLASTAEQSVEVSLVNYLWPTLMVLLAAAIGRPRRKGAVWRAIPGAVVATMGVALAVGGNSGLDVGAALGHVASDPLPYLLAFLGAFAWSLYAVITPAMSDGLDGTSVFFPGVAVVLWIIHLTSGEGMPDAVPGPLAWAAVVASAAVIAGGYAFWGYGILHGSLKTLAVASYATPVLSVAASAVILGLSLTLPFWCGALLVVAGSVLNWLAERLGGNKA